MKDGRSQGEPSYMRLKRLMETRMTRILGEERLDSGRIRLYGTGDWWVAFERSAYAVCRLFPQSRVSIAVNPATRVPVVMTGVPDAEVRTYARGHGLSCEAADRVSCEAADSADFPFVDIPAAEIRSEDYSRWRRGEVEKFAPALASIGGSPAPSLP